MGRFLTETLAREGCDVSHVSIDPARLTAAVVLGIKDRDTFPLIFYRENCADMAVTQDDVAESFLAQSKALLITGTHFSTPHVHQVSTTALERARRNDVRTVLDIDYRPVLWGLTKRGDGETRFIASDTVTAHLQGILPLFDLVIGTEEEFAIAGGDTDIVSALRAVRLVTAATLVVKRGPMGCAVIDGPIPRSLDDAFNGQGVRVEVLKRAGRGRCVLGGVPVRLGARRGLRSVLHVRQCLRRARRVAARLRARDAHARRARSLSRQYAAHSAAGPRRGIATPPPQDGAAHAAARALPVRVRPPRPALRARARDRRQ
jgi:sugar/nucleoside kinase (ribokinase family)